MLSEAKHLDLFSLWNRPETDQRFFALLRMTFSRDLYWSRVTQSDMGLHLLKRLRRVMRMDLLREHRCAAAISFRFARAM